MKLLLRAVLSAALLHTGSGLALRASRGVADALPQRVRAAGRTHLAMLAVDRSEELAKLLATLEGLKEDGFGPEALAPLEAKIAALTERVALAESLVLTTEQRRIWRLCDDIDDEADRTDSDSPARLKVLRDERRFLLEKLARSDCDAYAQLLRLLADNGRRLAGPDDLPAIGGVPLDSAAAVDRALSAELEARSLAQAAAQAESAAAAVPSSVEERKRAALERTDGSVDLNFVSARARAHARPRPRAAPGARVDTLRGVVVLAAAPRRGRGDVECRPGEWF